LSEDGQPFFFTTDDTGISISRDGMVSTVNGDIGRLGLVTFENEQQLMNVANGLYMPVEGAQPTPAAERNIAQGYLEKSNIQGVVEMSRMIEISRAYQSVQGFIDKEDERMKKMLSLMSLQQA
ncbi:MAG: flagellar basal-body rod protein FlgF, partial [Rhodospirillales bacterium]|nr:flagellar basal-body rod protein FlgF [Rhodospirillales bacterium]